MELWSIWVDAGPGRGSVALVASGEALDPLDTSAPALSPAYASVRGEGLERLTIRGRGDGPLLLFGATLERDQSGVVVDELGIGGSGLRRMLDWDWQLMRAHLRRRDPALVILAHGGTESMRKDHDPVRWAADLDELLGRFRDAVPGASCLFVGPHDRAPKFDGKRRRPEALDGVIKIARARAFAHGCAFFDLQAVMGGPGSMPAWVEAELAMADHVHFTPRGNAEIGRVFVDALMAPHDARARGTRQGLSGTIEGGRGQAGTPSGLPAKGYSRTLGQGSI